MDNEIEETRESKAFDCKFSSKDEISIDNISRNMSNKFKTLEEFNEIRKTIRKNIRELSREILKGNVNAVPLKTLSKDACEFCEFGSICLNKS
jgi:ATP-dependent helicase/DNAse subunit B